MLDDELTPDIIREMMATISPNHKELFKKLISECLGKESISPIKNWVLHFEVDNPIDQLLALIINDVIKDIGGGLAEKIENNKKKFYSGEEIMFFAVDILRKISSDIESRVTGFRINRDNHNEKSN